MRSLAIAVLLALAALAVLPAPAAAGEWTWPLEGELITPYRNGADPYAAGQHRGIDIAAPAGSEVRAADSGVVTFAGVAGSSGLTVAVRTNDSRYVLSYLHLESVAVREGARLGRGERVGNVGTSGRRSAEQPHLHFGVRLADSRHDYRDPLDFLAPPRKPRPAPEPRPVPVALPHAPLLPQPVPAARPRPAPVRTTRPAPAPSRVRLGSAPHGAAAREASQHPALSARTPPEKGLDLNLGWLAACCGTVLVALALGRSAGPAAAARHGRAAVAALMRPLAGRQ